MRACFATQFAPGEWAKYESCMSLPDSDDLRCAQQFEDMRIAFFSQVRLSCVVHMCVLLIVLLFVHVNRERSY